MSSENLKEALFSREKKFIFLLSTYITCTLLFAVSANFSTELFHTNDFMIGEATVKGVNVSARISNFYTLLLFCLVTFAIFYGLFTKLMKSFIERIERKDELSTLLILQILLATFYFFNGEKSESDAVLHLSILFLFGLEITHYYFKKEFIFFKGDVLKSLFLSTIGLYLITENIFITGTVLLILLILFRIKKIQNKFNSISVALSALPLLLFITVEITLILNQNGFYNWQYWLTGSFVFLSLLSILYWRKINQKELSKIIFKWEAPVVILGACIYSVYSPIIPLSGDLFESANNLNPLMMSEVYHSTYYIDYISSHLMSDYFWMKLFALLNGYQNDTAQLIYYGLSFCVYILAIYYFLKEYFKSHFGIIIFMLFMPYLYFYFAYSYAFALIPLIFLSRFFSTKEVRFLWWFGITSTLTLFWRLDVGIATIGASVVIFVFLFLMEKKWRVTLLKIATVLILFYGALFTLYYSYCSDLISEALHYFGGSQAHGNSQLTPEKSNLFYLDYFILPGLISLCVLYLLFNFKKHKNENFFWIVLFFSAFYFFNFQRGLVRHSFMSMNESYITSFAWVILILMYLRLYKVKLSMALFSVFMVGGFLLSIHSIENKKSLLNESKSFSVNNLPKINGKKIVRATENIDFEEYTKPAVDFLKQQLKNDETFFDFSNSPILYYHTEKKIPTQFSQSLQYIVDIHLQKECVKRIQKVKIPWIVYSQTHEAFGDNIDGVPNGIRYYYIASYLIDNYTPSNNYGTFHLWKKKNENQTDTSAYEVRKEHWKLGLMPYFWKSNSNEPKLKFKRKVSFENGKAAIGNIVGGDFIQLTVKSEKETELRMWMKGEEYNDFFVQIDLKKGTNNYKFPICGSYYIRTANNPVLEFETDSNNKILKIEILNQ